MLIDPWPPEFESALQIDSVDAAGTPEVDSTVETTSWAPVAEGTGQHRRVYFVDGVRRVEARVLTDYQSNLVYGLLGSVGVGATCCEDLHAWYDQVEVTRFAILGAGLRQTELVSAGGQQLCFDGIASAFNTPMEVTSELQNLMRTREAALGHRLLASGACVFADGPLTYFSTATEELVGVIKRLYLAYLDPQRFQLVPKLRVGQRTPLFLIQDGKYDRYAWFLRLAEGRTIDYPLAGVIRLEVRSAVGLQKAKELADFSAEQLPRFASSPTRDSRAPQNLVPVGALEEELRHRLGDAQLIRRSIEVRLSQGAST
jgi:uncharacterized protein